MIASFYDKESFAMQATLSAIFIFLKYFQKIENVLWQLGTLVKLPLDGGTGLWTVSNDHAILLHTDSSEC